MVEPTTDRELFDLVDAWAQAQAPRNRAEAMRQCSVPSLSELIAARRVRLEQAVS